MFKVSDLKNPFVGLRAFEIEETHLFFGRKRQIEEIVKKLHETNFAAVIGYSGSGKSSLIKSGIIPELKKKMLFDGKADWKIGLFTPGYNPIDRLVTTLLDTNNLTKDRKEELRPSFFERFVSTNFSIYDALKEIEPEYTGNYLVIVDQFEELFSLSKKDNKAALFIQLLLESIKNKQHKIYVILTLRSDFLGSCTEFEGLTEALNKSQYLVPRLTENQYKEAILGPLGVYKYKISDEFLKMLTQSIDSREDQLSVLQHAMMRTIELWKTNNEGKGDIDTHHYKAIGTMEKALSNHAEEAFEELEEEEKKVCKKMFQVLVNFDNLQITKNPISFARLLEITAAERKDLKRVIDVFRSNSRAFLYPKESVSITDSTIIDISHESLLRLWRRLNIWIKEEMESSKIYKNLCEAAELYQDGKGSLLVNPELEITLKWKETQNPTEEWGSKYNSSYSRAINFLQTSEHKFDEDIVRKNAAQAKRIKRNKQFTTFISIAFVICLFLVVFSWIEKQKAVAATKLATQKSVEAEINKNEAIVAKDSADILRNRAVKNAQIAVNARDSANIARQIAVIKSIEAEENRIAALIAKDSAEVSRNQALSSAENEKIAAQVAKEASKKAQEEELEAKRLKQLSDAIKMAFESEKSFDLKQLEIGISQAVNSHLLFIENSLGSKRQNQIYSALNRSLFEGKNLKTTFYQHDLGLSKIIKSPKNNITAVLDNSGKVILLNENTEGFTVVNSNLATNVATLYYSKNGRLILGTNDGKVTIYDSDNPLRPTQNFNYPNKVRFLSSFISNDVEHLLIAEGEQIHAVNMATFTTSDTSSLPQVDTLGLGMFSINNVVAIHQKNRIALFTLSVANAKIVSKPLGTVEGTTDLTAINLSSSGLIATGSNKGKVHVYQLEQNKPPRLLTEITNHKNVKISQIAFYETKTETLIITSSYDNTINVADLNNPDDFIALKGHTSWVKDFYFDDFQKKIYSVSQDSFLRYWFIDSTDIITQLNKSHDTN